MVSSPRKPIYNAVVALTAFAVILFAVSLGFNALILSGSSLPGFFCLLLGFFHIAWYANPLFFLSVAFLLIDRPHWGIGTSFFSLLLALSTFSVQEVTAGDTGSKAVMGYGPGFYLWLASIVVVLLTSFLAAVTQSEETASI
ncbi:MAG TPA: hypothetical protein VLQ45_19675, partial [Thermoanaerobaculia bacterium]|nr:hypothetical protein [Thermoanaerobaculia bacterium]